MITFKRPMLAASLLKPTDKHDDETILRAMHKLKYPVLATLKKDGIRALRLNGSLLSRTLKPIPNKSIRERSLILPGGFDMELWNPLLTYDEIESIVMSREHPRSGEIQFHVLDWFNKELIYSDRCYFIRDYCLELNRPDVDFSHPVLCEYNFELMDFFYQSEKENGEGICFRTLSSPYKQGRSTLKEQYLVKLARFITGEAVIVGFEEQMENGNSSKRNAVGMMDRSSAKDGLMGKNTLGALWVRDIKTNQEFKIGTGFDDKTRRTIWNNKKEYMNKIVSYQHKPHGQKLLPRCPSYKGLRKEIDIV